MQTLNTKKIVGVLLQSIERLNDKQPIYEALRSVCKKMDKVQNCRGQYNLQIRLFVFVAGSPSWNPTDSKYTDGEITRDFRWKSHSLARTVCPPPDLLSVFRHSMFKHTPVFNRFISEAEYYAKVGSGQKPKLVPLANMFGSIGPKYFKGTK